MIVDLTQFWRDHPHYVGVKKEFGIYGFPLQMPTFPSTNNRAEFQVALDHDFIATEVRTAVMNTGNNVLTGAVPINVQIYLPGHGGRQLITNAQSPLLKFDYLAVMRTQPGTASKGNSFSWTWPYPAIIPAGERLMMEADWFGNFPATLFVGFHGLKAFL